MTYLLDTALLSELVKRAPNPDVVAWVDAQEEATLFVSVITFGELQKGISKLQDSQRKTTLQAWLSQSLTRRFGRRALPVDYAVAVAWGALQGDAERSGQTLPAVDCLIAATAQVHDLTVVTRNERDIQRCGARVINPWHAASP